MTSRRKTWVISDTHFYHKKMVELCNRPNDFDKIITKNINQLIKPQDMLIHLGDVTWKEFPHWPCETILVKGNHDSKSYTYYKNHGFVFCCDTFSIKYGGLDIIFSHKPLIFHDHDLNIHGHLHNMAEIVSVCPSYLVSLENNGYMPELLDKIISKHIKNQEREK